MHEILIVEDDRALREGLAAALSGELSVRAADSLSSAREAVAQRTPELALLDCNLPDGSGLTLCPELTRAGVAVIFLTVRDGELDEVAALRAGAVDYVKKPFSLMILRERILSALRRRSSGLDYSDEHFEFSFAAQEFRADGEELHLSLTEQKLLACLIENRGRIVTRQKLCDFVWGFDGQFVDENTLSVAVRRLRAKLGGEHIATCYGLGYMWK